ncbi:MAG: NUDIX hydrolase [Burkholderiales bacterium]|nr:NUDIX hydrolase [Anaerolineae bacterium]
MLLRRMPWLAVAAFHVWRLRRPKFSAGAVGVIFNTAGEVLLVEHVFHPQNPWGLPGGWVERNEDPSVTIQREIQEELGLTVEVGPVLLTRMDRFNHLDFAFLCQTPNAQPATISALSSELLDYSWFDPRQLPRLHSFHYRAIMRALESTSIGLDPRVLSWPQD